MISILGWSNAGDDDDEFGDDYDDDGVDDDHDDCEHDFKLKLRR